LQDRYPRTFRQSLHKIHGRLFCQAGAFGNAPNAAHFAARVEQEQHVRWDVSHASYLLGYAILEYEDIVNFQGWVVMPVGIQGDNW